MFFIIDKPRFERMLRIARPKTRGRERRNAMAGPYLRIEAREGLLRLSSRDVVAEYEATVLEPGVLFLREHLFMRMLHSLRGEKQLSIQATRDTLLFGDIRMPLVSNEMLLYADPAAAPPHHPTEMQDEADEAQSSSRDSTLWDIQSDD